MDFLDRWTDLDCKVKDIKLVNDHYLVYKIKAENKSSGKGGTKILMPDIFVEKSIRNLSIIKGLVVKASDPFRSRIVRKRLVGFDVVTGNWTPKAIVKVGTVQQPVVAQGDGILYNSYCVGKVAVEGYEEPLVIVRGIDIEASFPMEVSDSISLSRVKRIAS
jgi:hypothetical protein